MGHDAGRDGEAERLGLAIELAEQHAGLRRTAARASGSTRIPLIGAEVDEHAVVAHRQPGKAVAAAAYRDREPVVSTEAERGAHVGDAGAAGDERGMSVDRAVPHLAVFVVTPVSRAEHVSDQVGTQPGDRRRTDRARKGRA